MATVVTCDMRGCGTELGELNRNTVLLTPANQQWFREGGGPSQPLKPFLEKDLCDPHFNELVGIARRIIEEC